MVNKITKAKIVMKFLSDYSKRYYLRELALELKKPHQTIKPHVEELVKHNVLLKAKRANTSEYALNLENPILMDYLTLAEKEKSIDRLDGDLLLKTLFEKLSPYFNNNIFIIFGSSVDNLKQGSDIDLLVVGKSFPKNTYPTQIKFLPWGST